MMKPIPTIGLVESSSYLAIAAPSERKTPRMNTLRLLFILLAFMLYASFHSLLASLWAKGKARARLGLLSDRTYRLSYNLIAGITFIPVLAVMALFPGDTLYRLRWPWTVLTMLLQILGAIILMVGILQTDIWHFLGLRRLAVDLVPTGNDH
jgi:hypothetical protein